MSGTLDNLFTLIAKGKKGENIGLKTGLEKLDKLIGGIQPSRYYVLAAASAGGKTSFIIFLIYNLLKQITKDKPIYILYESLEISKDILVAKLLSLYCAENFGLYLTINDILSFEKPISDYALSCLNKARTWFESIQEHIEILDHGINSKTIYRDACVFAEKHGSFEIENDSKKYIPNNPNQLLIGFIDHYNLTRPQQGNTLKQEIDQISSWIVTLRNMIGMSWFALMQQNRDASSMERRKADMSEPGLNDVRDTSGPVQDADIVLQLFFPFREKITTYRGFPIVGEQGYQRGFRSIILSKKIWNIKIILFICIDLQLKKNKFLCVIN